MESLEGEHVLCAIKGRASPIAIILHAAEHVVTLTDVTNRGSRKGYGEGRGKRRRGDRGGRGEGIAEREHLLKESVFHEWGWE